jgi:hypothetical protein
MSKDEKSFLGEALAYWEDKKVNPSNLKALYYWGDY